MKKSYSIIGDVRGIGLMVAVEFTDFNGISNTAVGRAVFEAAEQNGLVLICSGNVLRFAPPLNVTEEEVSICLEKLEKSIQEVME